MENKLIYKTVFTVMILSVFLGVTFSVFDEQLNIIYWYMIATPLLVFLLVIFALLIYETIFKN